MYSSCTKPRPRSISSLLQLTPRRHCTRNSTLPLQCQEPVRAQGHRRGYLWGLLASRGPTVQELGSSFGAPAVPAPSKVTFLGALPSASSRTGQPRKMSSRVTVVLGADGTGFGFIPRHKTCLCCRDNADNVVLLGYFPSTCPCTRPPQRVSSGVSFVSGAIGTGFGLIDRHQPRRCWCTGCNSW